MFQRFKTNSILNIVVCIVLLVPTAIPLIIGGHRFEGGLVLMAIAALVGGNIGSYQLITKEQTKYLFRLIALSNKRTDQPNDRASGLFGTAQFNGAEWRYTEETRNPNTHGICPQCHRSWVTSGKKIFCVCGSDVEMF